MQASNIRRTSILGHVLLLVGFAVLLPGLVVIVAIAAAIMSGEGRALGDSITAARTVVLVIAIVAGAAMFYKGAALRNDARKMRTVDGWTLLKEDDRAPILYLRSFLDDEKTSPAQMRFRTGGGALIDGLAGAVVGLLGSAPGTRRTQEEVLVAELGELGPCIAIGDPSEKLPDLGAARIYLNDDWQQQVATLMGRAHLIVFRIGSQSPGFWWEVERVRRTIPAHRVVFWIPPEAELGSAPARAYEEFTQKLGKDMPMALPAWRYGTKMLRFRRNDWNSGYLSPSLDDHPKVVWPKPPSPFAARFQQIVLAVFVAIAAVRLFTGTLTPKDLLKSAMFGSLAPSRPSKPAVRSAEYLAEAAREANRSLPKMVDSVTEATNISSAEGLLEYHYRITNVLAKQVEAGAIDSLKPAITKGACAAPETRKLIDAGVSLRYSYSDKQGAAIGSVDVGRFDCPKAWESQ